ncbi:MAG: TonB-dependent receptor [Bacteroidetes bacterium]|nr:TonB-dependent receptor [Bacteroidota bacterium]
MKHYFKSIVLFFIAGIFTLSAFSQDAKMLVLKAGKDGEPLSFAHYTYGSQKGIADVNGQISLIAEPNASLEISHLSTGYQKIAADAVLQAINSGKLHISSALAYNLQPVTVIAIRPSTSGKETLKVGSQEQISHDAGAYLQQNPAISGIRKSSSSALDPVLRGFKYEQLTIVTDGSCASTAACPNRMDPPSSQISLNMTEKVEVYKGPYALRFGNSFGGTINFISAAARFTPQLKPLARVTAGYESNGQIFRTEAMAGLSTKAINWQVFGALSQGGDYKAGNGEEVLASFYRNSIGTNFSALIGKMQDVKFSVQHNYAKDVDFPSLPMDLRTDDAWMINARHTIRFAETSLQQISTSAYATFVDHFMDNRLKALNPRMMNAETPATTSNMGGRSEAVFQKGNMKFYAGADIKREEAEGTRKREFLMGPMAGKTLFDNAWQHGFISKYSLFAEHQSRYEDWGLIVSGRFELNRSDVKDPDDKFLDAYPDPAASQLNPSLSAGLTRYWSNSFSTALWLGRTQRSGSLTERYINFLAIGLDAWEMVGNPEIKPEVNNQIDLSLNFQKENTSLSFSVFASYLQDYISGAKDTTLVPSIASSPGVRRFINVDKALLTGFEAGFGQLLPLGMKFDLSMAYVYGQNLVTDAPLAEIPPLDIRLSLSGSYFDGKLNPALTYRYVTEQERVSEEFSENSTPAFSLLDISVDYKLLKSLKMRAGVKNLLDEAYYEHLTRAYSGKPDSPLYAPGRNVYLTLNYTLP